MSEPTDVVYRQSQDAPYPASILDINLGVRWVKANAQHLNGTDRVSGMGSSRGGRQILRPGDERYALLPGHPQLDASLSYVVACWPVAHPLKRDQRARELNLDGVAADEAYWPSEAAMDEGNRYLIVERGDAQELTPMLVLQGTADDFVPLENAGAIRAHVWRHGCRGPQSKGVLRP